MVADISNESVQLDSANYSTVVAEAIQENSTMGPERGNADNGSVSGAVVAIATQDSGSRESSSARTSSSSSQQSSSSTSAAALLDATDGKSKSYEDEFANFQANASANANQAPLPEKMSLQAIVSVK